MKCKMQHIIPACSLHVRAEGKTRSALHIISIITTIITTTIITPLGL